MGSEPRPLWQHTLLWIGEASNLTAMHPLDIDRAKRVLSDLSAVGERPPYEEVKTFLAQVWAPWPDSQRQVRELWRKLWNNPGHRFRLMRNDHRFYTLDRLTQQHGLHPLEDRLQAVGECALDACVRATSQGTAAEFATAAGALHHVATALTDLRRLRWGPAAVGGWWDRFDSEAPPAGTRGVLV